MDRFVIVFGHYLYYTENYRDQGSREYSRLSKISRYFSPSPGEWRALAKGDRPEVVEIYNALAARHGTPVFSHLRGAPALLPCGHYSTDPTEDCGNCRQPEDTRATVARALGEG